jgi:hypothetical protein
MGKSDGVGVILFETVFPLAYICSPTLFLVLLTGGLIMHLLIGFIMGLNDFVWSFAAAYPSLLYLYFVF